MQRSVDLRYHGQSFELPVTVPPGSLSAADVARLPEQFHAMHERAYGYAAPEDSVELVNVRLAAIGVTSKPRRAPLPGGGPAATRAQKGHRAIWFAETGGFQSATVFDRGKLLRDNVLDGPAIIEEPDSCTPAGPPPWMSTATSSSAPLRAEADTQGAAGGRCPLHPPRLDSARYGR